MPPGRRQGRPRPRRFVLRVPILCFLVIVWIMLWDSVSMLTVLTGIGVAFGVMWLFRLPPIKLSGRFNIIYGLRFVGWFVYKVCTASVHVAWLAVRPKQVGPGSMVAVALNTRSDLLITLVTLVNGLLPGTFVTEVDRANAVLYLHALGANTSTAVEQARAETYTIERHLVMALGSAHDLAALNEWRLARGEAPVLRHKALEGLRERHEHSAGRR